MPLHQAWGVTCNGCGEPLDPWLQYETEAEARNAAGAHDWHVAPNGAALCPDCDGENH